MRKMSILMQIILFCTLVIDLIVQGNLKYLLKSLGKNGYRPIINFQNIPSTDNLFQDAMIIRNKMEAIRLRNSIRIFALDLSPGCRREDKKKNTCMDTGKCQVKGNESDLSSTLFGFDTENDNRISEDVGCDEKKTKIDMLKNPPSNTQYQGGEIWNAIYSETETIDFPLLPKLISGIQSNIAIHASERYKKVGENEFEYSLSNFMNKFAVNEDRGINLMVTFYYIVQSLCKLGPKFEEFMERNLDDTSDNRRLKEEVKLLFEPKLYNSCQKQYIDSLTIPNHILAKLDDFFETFISMLGCVECEKCVLHGTIKGKTLELATKSFGRSSDIILDPITFVTYLNGLYIFSTSITIIDLFTLRIKTQLLFLVTAVALIVIVHYKLIFGRSSDIEKTCADKIKRD